MKLQSRTKKNNENGAVQIMAVFGLLSVLLFLSLQIENDSEQYINSPSLRILRSKFALEIVRDNLTEMLSNSSSKEFTVDDSSNTSFSCVKSKNFCAKTVQAFNKLKAPDGSTYLDTKTMGFDKRGATCLKKNDDCIVHVNLSWEPTCAGGCIDPNIKFYVDFTSSGKVSLDLEKYKTEILAP